MARKPSHGGPTRGGRAKGKGAGAGESTGTRPKEKAKTSAKKAAVKKKA